MREPISKTIIREQAKFFFNKIRHGIFGHITHGTKAVNVDSGGDGVLRQVRILKAGKLLGQLEYFAAVNEEGVLRGGHPASSYLNDLVTDKCLDERQKLRVVCQLIAQLPGNVLFGLTASPFAKDLDVLKKAFGSAGFKIWPQATFIYSPPADGSDLIASMKGARMRTMLRAANRVLDVIEISPEELVHQYVKNLEAAGKENYCSPAIDLALLKDGVDRDPPQARIIAARLKPTPDNPYPTRIESAIALTLGDDGLCKLFRITYHQNAYKHATKLLVLEACAIAARYGKVLDTDAASKGGMVFYKLFGSFKESTRYEFVRYPIRFYIQHIIPSLARRLGLFEKAAPPVVFPPGQNPPHQDRALSTAQIQPTDDGYRRKHGNGQGESNEQAAGEVEPDPSVDKRSNPGTLFG
ncbi:MAG TPA: hypothetical protein DDY32_00970 [Desulfobulbaceae bacterium]|nr:hypothetical protein [Desulfobulbaceae bacterium]